MKRFLNPLLTVVVAFAFWGCDSREAAEDHLLKVEAQVIEEEPRYTVARGDVAEKIQFLSSVAPIDERPLFFRADGRVWGIYVDEGDWVRNGQVLAELEMTDLLNRVDQAVVTVEKMRMQLEEIEKNTIAIARAEAELAIKQLELERLAAQDPDIDITIAKANLDKAAIVMEEARVADEVYGQSTPSRELREAQLNHTIAGAGFRRAGESLEIHRIRLAILREEVRLARVNLEELRTRRDPQAMTDLKLAELSLKQLEDQAAMFRLVAPMDGQVMSSNLVSGSEIRAYRQAIIVADPSTFELNADLLREESMQLHVGLEAQIELVNQPGRVMIGTVRRLPYGGLEASELLEVVDRSTRIQFDPPQDMRLEVGDLARATIVLETREDVLYLPPEAIRVYQGRRFVVVDEGDLRRRVDVKIGLDGDDRVEIESGLELGQVIIGQ